MRLHLILLVSISLACSGRTSTDQSIGGSGNLNPSVGGGGNAGNATRGILGSSGGSRNSNPSIGSGGNTSSAMGGVYSGPGGSGTSQPKPNDAGIGTDGGSPLGTGGITSTDAGTNPAGSICVTDGGLSAYQSSASGSLSSTNLDAVICTGGAFAYMERTQASSYVGSQLLVIIDSSLYGNSANNFQFKTPADATGADLSILAGVNAAIPGTYASSKGQSCGSLVFCMYLPLPAAVHCPDDAGVCDSQYCSMQGSVMNPQCGPVTPEVCYQAQGTSNCLPGSETPIGSWTLTLTSVTPYVSDAGSGSMSYYVVHGTLTATMIEVQSAADAGVVTADLAMSF